MSKGEYKQFKKNGFVFNPNAPRGGISSTSTKVRPNNPDMIKRSTGALGADYYVDIDVSNKDIFFKGITKGGVPDWKIQDNVNVSDIINSGKVKNELRSVEELKINRLKLRDIVNRYEIREQEFEYAGINGIAELLGWQIIFFCKNNDLSNTVVISFTEIDNIELINIANSILNFIDMDIRFGDCAEVINSIYGIADFIDSLYEDIIRYNYIISPDLFITFGLRNNILSC